MPYLAPSVNKYCVFVMVNVLTRNPIIYYGFVKIFYQFYRLQRVIEIYFLWHIRIEDILLADPTQPQFVWVGVDFVFPCHKKEKKKNPHQASSRRDDPTWKFGDCLVGVWRASRNCLEGVWRVSGWCLAGVWWMSGGCFEGVWKVPGGCLEGIYRMSEW